MKDKRKFERHERMYGPHFNEECATKVVAKMENEDGTTGQHWTINDTTTVANQYGISFDPRKYNKYDWYVAMNMVYSDYYKFIINTLHSNNIKYFVDLAKAWLEDKDIDEGKMWYYYKYVMCDLYRDDEEDDEEYYDEYEYSPRQRYSMNHRPRYSRYEYDDDYDEKEYKYSKSPMRERLGSKY